MPNVNPRKEISTVRRVCRDCRARTTNQEMHHEHHALCRFCGDAEVARGYDLPAHLRPEWEAYRRGQGRDPTHRAA